MSEEGPRYLFEDRRKSNEPVDKDRRRKKKKLFNISEVTVIVISGAVLAVIADGVFNRDSLRTVANDLGDIEQKVEKAQTNIESLELRVRDAETSITKLETIRDITGHIGHNAERKR